MHDDAEAFVGGDHGSEPYEPHGRGEDPPPAAYSRECEEHCYDEAEDNVRHAHGPDEEDTRLVAVADGPADEIGMGLASERSLGNFERGEQS